MFFLVFIFVLLSSVYCVDDLCTHNECIPMKTIKKNENYSIKRCEVGAYEATVITDYPHGGREIDTRELQEARISNKIGLSSYRTGSNERHETIHPVFPIFNIFAAMEDETGKVHTLGMISLMALPKAFQHPPLPLNPNMHNMKISDLAGGREVTIYAVDINVSGIEEIRRAGDKLYKDLLHDGIKVEKNNLIFSVYNYNCEGKDCKTMVFFVGRS